MPNVKAAGKFWKTSSFPYQISYLFPHLHKNIQESLLRKICKWALEFIWTLKDPTMSKEILMKVGHNLLDLKIYYVCSNGLTLFKARSGPLPSCLVKVISKPAWQCLCLPGGLGLYHLVYTNNVFLGHLASAGPLKELETNVIYVCAQPCLQDQPPGRTLDIRSYMGFPGWQYSMRISRHLYWEN